MVDVKTFECFPTLIHSFALKINHEPMITSLRSTENTDQLFLLPSFNSLVDGIIEATTQVLKKLEYSFVRCLVSLSDSSCFRDLIVLKEHFR